MQIIYLLSNLNNFQELIKLYFTKNNVEDFFILEGDNIEEIQEQVKVVESDYNINPEDNNMWSKVVE